MPPGIDVNEWGRGWFVCLHPVHHNSLLGEFHAWKKEHGRLRWRQVLTLPTNGARRVAAAVKNLLIR
jgi:DNA mismatch repair protein MutH